MSESVPTQRQYSTLLALGSGSAGLSRTKRDTEPLLKRGWVTADFKPPYYQWVRITADGLHALARAVAKFGLPEMKGGTYYPRVCAECGRDWRPKCRCGGSLWRHEAREMERDAA